MGACAGIHASTASFIGRVQSSISSRRSAKAPQTKLYRWRGPRTCGFAREAAPEGGRVLRGRRIALVRDVPCGKWWLPSCVKHAELEKAHPPSTHNKSNEELPAASIRGFDSIDAMDADWAPWL